MFKGGIFVINRRDFINKSIKGTFGLFAVTTLPVGLSACSNEKSIDTSAIANLGSLKELQKGEFPKKVPYIAIFKDAWAEQERKGFVYINKNTDGSLLILSPICTHLGCVVGDASNEKVKEGITYACPCHGGYYDEFGINVEGPPPRPLDKYEAFLQDDNVYIAILSPLQREKPRI